MRMVVLAFLVLITLGAADPAASLASTRLTAEWRDRLVAAVTAHKAGDWKAAARDFAAASQAATPIPEYALYFEADSLANLGDVAGARAAATKGVERAGDGPLLGSLLLLAARTASAAGDEAATASLYRRFVERFPDHAEAPKARYLLGQALMATGQGAEAVGVYRAIWLTAPASPYAESAAQQQRVLAERGFASSPFSAGERLARAERLLAAGLPAPARVEADAVLADSPTGDTLIRALRIAMEASRRAGRFEEALRFVDRALAAAPVERRPWWLLERARLLPRDRDAALATLDRLVKEHPKSPEAPDALLQKAQIAEGIPSSAALAEATYAKLADEYPDETAAGEALWRLGWLSWFRGAYEEAAQRWDRLAAIRGGRRLSEGGMYWAGRALDARGDAAGAERRWSEIRSTVPRSYYGVLATVRLRREGADPPRDGLRPLVALPAAPLETLRDDARYAKVEALRAVGLEAFADGEMDELARRAAGDTARLYALSAAYVQDSRHHLALRILRRDFVTMARSGPDTLPRSFWEMFYPLAWRTELTSAATRATLDPLFVAAVVREESSFNPQARSRVGARGLMQLMPETARPMARSRGLAFQDGDLLDEPRANLELGAAFIGGLVRDFGDPRLAVAAYNAGPRRVREWWAARRSPDVEVWIEQIPFAETRFFVKRVVLAWQEYRRVYGAQP